MTEKDYLEISLDNPGARFGYLYGAVLKTTPASIAFNSIIISLFF